MAAVAPRVPVKQLFIDNRWVESATGRTFDDVNPATEEVIARIAEADAADVDRAAKVVVGTVWVNCWFVRDLRVPFGGAKASGIGREGGKHSWEFYTEAKNVCIAI
jgi:acyl-CoA reductase-like NAD-dependent aldehyde dehydrogenase